MSLKSKTDSELKKMAREIEREMRVRGAKNGIGDVPVKEIEKLVKKLKPLVLGKRIKLTINPKIKMEAYVCLSDSGTIDWRYAGQLENYVYDDVYDSVVTNKTFCSEINKAEKRFNKIDMFIGELSQQYNVDGDDLFQAACEMAVREVDFAPGYDS